MSSASAAVSRRSRRFVFVGATFLLAWQVATAVGVPRRATVALGLYGFVFHVVFGKAYALVPTYFDRALTPTWAPAVQLPATAGAVVFLTADAVGVVGWGVPDFGASALGTAGALLWTFGVAVFVSSLGWTVRGNLTGAETATSDANADRRPVDRAANALVPVALGYLLAGSYALLALESGLPSPLDGYPPRSSHLLAVGAATTLLFAVGLRLLPRFFAATVPRAFVWAVVPTGAVGPFALALTLPAGPWFPTAALVEATAVCGYAAVVLALFVRSERRRVGFYGPLVGAACGVLGVALGLWFALGGPVAALAPVHLRLNVLGFLGLTIVGVTFQFYPPAVGSFPGASDRTAAAILAALLGGLVLEVSGRVAAVTPLRTVGAVLGTAAALAYVALLLGLFRERYG
jgi:hypothetical protein